MLHIYRHLMHVLKLFGHIPARRQRLSCLVSPTLKGCCVMSKLSNTWPRLKLAIVSQDTGSHKLPSQNALGGATGRATCHLTYLRFFSPTESSEAFSQCPLRPRVQTLEFMSANF